MAKSQRDERTDQNGQPAQTPESPQQEQSEAAPDQAPARRRAPRSRSKAAPAPTTEDSTPTAEDESAETKRPARRRTRAASPPAEEPAAEEAKPRRRARRKADAQPVASSDEIVPEAPQDDAGQTQSEAQPEPEPQTEQRAPQQQSDDGDHGRNGRDPRKRNKRKKKKGPQGSGGGGGHPGQPFVGMLEMIGDKNFGFIREVHTSLPKGDNDPFMPPPLIDKYKIRDGAILEGVIKPGRKGAWQVTDVTKVMDVEPEQWKEYPSYDEGTTIYPNEKLELVTSPSDVTMRVIDLVAPLGKGQRALIVAPPRAGKTIILKQMARSMAQNHPEVKLVALLIDERPEEVTDFKRTTSAMVFASSNDYQEDNHIRVATLAFEYCRRLVEMGEDVVLLLDSLTRLGRTFNLWGGNSGRTMSGGLDARALLMPRKIFGAARNIEHGGSLTIIATALIETGSRMDDVIFEEFKGTGNAEIVLDRELADKRIYPAINLRKSGTRNIERLLGDEMLHYHNLLMRALNSRHPVEAMQALIRHVQSSPDNVHLLNELIPSEI